MRIKVDPIIHNFENFADADWIPSIRDGLPVMKYIIAAMPRSGSNLLLRQLSRSGCGMPAEYLQPFISSHFLKSLGALPQDEIGYLRHIISVRQTESGIFGMKSHWEQWNVLSEQAVKALTDDAKFIFTRRRDLAMQALSLERALRSGKWDPRWKPNLRSRDNEADPESLVRLLLRASVIAEEEQAWDTFFKKYSIRPLQIYYEDLMSDHDDVMMQIFDFLEVEAYLPRKEPAPKGKTGEIGRDGEMVNSLREALAKQPIERPDFQ